MKTFRIVKCYDVQVTYEVEVIDDEQSELTLEEQAEEKTSSKNKVNEDWEYTETLETIEVK